MSVCVAVLCEDGKAIAFACDEKVDFGGYSADMAAIKNTPLTKNWVMMFAGDDMEFVDPIISRSKEILMAKGEEEERKPVEVANAVDQAYGEVLQSQIARKVLRKRGFDVESFRDKGKQKCTPSAYLNLCNKIDQVSISLKFLICGFDPKGDGHILCVDGENTPASYSTIGMWAIGSGSYSAMSWLAFFVNRGQMNSYSPKQRGAYFAITAKFMAESSGDVGKATFALVIEKSNKGGERVSASPIPYQHVQEIRKMWNTEGTPRVPANLDEMMKGHILTWAEWEQQVEVEERKKSQHA